MTTGAVTTGAVTSGDGVTVVVATRNRLDQLRRTLPRHTGPVVLVDNGSTDGTAAAVRREFAGVEVIELGRNAGAPARNVGVRRAGTPVVAFADDDSWWEPESLAAAAALFDRHPRLGLVAGRVLVGPDNRLDPTSRLMAESPLGTEPGAPGPAVLGFLACGAVVRREAFLAAGGFDDIVFFFGEEERIALDLAAAGWQLCYVDSLVAHHHPDTTADRTGRTALAQRNQLLTAVLRRPWPVVAGMGFRLVRQGGSARAPLVQAARRLPRAMRHRRRLPVAVEAARRRLDRVTLP